MPTNILSLPLYEVVVESHHTEDARAQFAVAGGEPPAPIALAGIDFRLQLRPSADSRDVALSASIADGRLAIAGHVLIIAIDQAVMARLAPRDYVWDVLAVADGVEQRLITGTWRHRLGVTRP